MNLEHVKDAHDQLFEALEHPKRNCDNIFTAAVRLCEALNNFYETPSTYGRPIAKATGETL